MSIAREEKKRRRSETSYYQETPPMTPEYVNSNFPIKSIRKYSTGIMVIRGSRLLPTSPDGRESRRGKITELSRKSLSRLAFLARESGTMFNSLLTLTYGAISPRDGRQLKVELNRALMYLRRKHSAQYIWFLEFTKRQIPHVHILLDHAPSLVDRFYLAEYWANGVAINWPTDLGISFTEQVNIRNKMFSVHFHKKAWEILRTDRGAARYVTKYATKIEQKAVPGHFQDVGRFWGASREVSLGDPEFEVNVSEDDLRHWLKETMDRDMSHYEVLPKYVYLFNDAKDQGRDKGQDGDLQSNTDGIW